MFGIASRSCAQPLPRIFVQEAHGDVERRAAPHFQAEQVVAAGARRSSAIAQHVVGAHARGQQRLVRIAERRVGDQQALLRRGSTRRTSPARARRSNCRVPARRRDCDRAAARGAARMRVGPRLARHLRIAVDDHVAEIGEQLGGAIAARREVEQLRRLVEEAWWSLRRPETSGC